MKDQNPGAADSARPVEALRELIEALDRRVPQVERLGETRIAREAATLRQEAMKRIEELRRARSDREADRADNVMADDGGPLPKPS